jgi:4'-phosphopantetheinyl transferase
MTRNSLRAHEVHTWLLYLSGSLPPDPATHLSREEMQRANRFVFAIDRERYIHAHYAMRRILGGYLGTKPHEVPLTFNRFGKPMLEPAHALAFSMSHSSDLGLLAVGSVAQVGVDIEQIAHRRGLRELADAMCTAKERRALDEIADAQFERAFLAIWTKKEALLKAIGVGLALDPALVHVGLGGDLHPITISAAMPYSPISVMSLPILDRHVAALAVTERRPRVRLFVDRILPVPHHENDRMPQFDHSNWAQICAGIERFEGGATAAAMIDV